MRNDHQATVTKWPCGHRIPRDGNCTITTGAYFLVRHTVINTRALRYADWLAVGRGVTLTFDFDFDIDLGLHHPIPEGYIYLYRDLSLQVGED
jgi:hypothetical protein